MIVIEFCGERHEVAGSREFLIGREGDLAIDDNRYLHRRFLSITFVEPLWWLVNVGSQLSATVSDSEGHVESWLSPGARLPLVFEHAIVRFTAGPTTYEIELTQTEPYFAAAQLSGVGTGETTIGRPPLTVDQRKLLVVLAEPLLRDRGSSVGAMPSSRDAADRLGWTITKFNRKLDNVCDKLERLGVRGLHGGADNLASSRRTRLVEYALAVRLVTREDLTLIE